MSSRGCWLVFGSRVCVSVCVKVPRKFRLTMHFALAVGCVATCQNRVQFILCHVSTHTDTHTHMWHRKQWKRTRSTVFFCFFLLARLSPAIGSKPWELFNFSSLQQREHHFSLLCFRMLAQACRVNNLFYKFQSRISTEICRFPAAGAVKCSKVSPPPPKRVKGLGITKEEPREKCKTKQSSANPKKVSWPFSLLVTAARPGSPGRLAAKQC